MGKHSADVPAWSTVPAPREDLVPASLPPIVKATASELGCWIDGARGGTATVRMVDIAVERGWPITDEDRGTLELARAGKDDDHHFNPEDWSEIQDDVEDWLNGTIAPDGYEFGWHKGDFMLWSEAAWCRVRGDRCWCVEPHGGS